MKFKRLLSCLVVFAFILSMLPMNVFAELGALTEVPANEIKYVKTTTTGVTSLHNESTPKGTYHVLFNEYITFILRPNGTSSTIPTRDLPTSFYTAMQGISFETLTKDGRYLRDIPVTEKVTFYGAKGYQMGFNYESGKPASIEKVGDNKLQAVYKMDTGDGNSNPVITVTYEIVRVDRGTTDGAGTDGIVQPDSSDSGRHWAVRASASVSYEGSKLIAKDNSDEGNMQANFTMVIDHIDFAKNRADDAQGAIQYSTYNGIYNGSKYIYEHSSSFWNSSNEMPRTVTDTPNGMITEFYTSSFGIANQFVATGSYAGAWQGGTNQLSGVAGHSTGPSEGGNYGQYVSYGNGMYMDFGGHPLYETNTLRTYSQAVLHALYRKDTGTMDGLWGYRDLYKKLGETSVPEQENNYVEVAQGGYLGIGKLNGKAYVHSGKSINALKNTHGDRLIAVLRGTYTKSYQGNGELFEFTDNVALSPTVTATRLGPDSRFTISSDGTVTMHNMGISCPSFQFYTPKNGMGVSFDYANSEGGLLKMKIDPEKNGSVLHLDIPGAQSIMSGVDIGMDGSLVFSGTMSIHTPVLEIVDLTLNEVGMGYKGDTYTVNGIAASGTVKMPELLGMPATGVEANINTFDGKELYDFSLSIEVPGLFETEAELTLVRLKNGSLAPDKLKLFVGGELGFPLVTPVVIAELNGVGGGFSNLADTVNGDFYAVPPLKLSITGQAEVLQMLSGRATMTVGLGYYEKKLHDPKFFNLFGLDAEYKESSYFTGDKRDYKGLTFTGVAVGGSKSLKVYLPNEDVRIVSIDSGLSIDAFAGVAKDVGDNYVMLDLNGDGKISGSLNFPAKIGKLKMPKKVAGKAITSTKLELSLGLKTMFDLNKDIEDIIWSGVKNASGNATVSYRKNIWACDLFVIAAFAKKNITVGVDTWLGDIDASFSWGKASNAKLMSYGETDDMYYALYLASDIESLGSTENMRLGVNMGDELVDQLEAAGITIEQNGEGENDYTLVISGDADPNRLLFTLTPKAEADDATLESMFTITKDGNGYPLTFDDYDDEGESTVPDANAYVSAGGYDEVSGGTFNGAVVTKFLDAGRYTISAQDPFDIEVLGFDLAEYIDTDGRVKELKEGRNYVIRTYLMDSEGEYHFVGEETPAANEDAVTDVEISPTQDSVPSGKYTKVYRLLEKLYAEESGDYYVTFDTYEGGEIDIINPNDVPAPGSVAAESVGSEILRATWTAPADSENIQGYLVTIYEQRDGAWVSTSTGYEVRADESGNIPTGIDMALTIGGNGDTDGDGTPDVENAVLEADKTYRVSVASLSDLTADLDADNKEETIAKRSAEVFSEGVFIPRATPPELEYSPAPEILEGSNMKTLFVNPETSISISSNPAAKITVTNTHDDREILKTESEVEETDFVVPEFEGSLILQIDAQDAQGDMTRDYITLKKDTVAPVITVDGEIFMADSNGNFTITGTTESGAEIIVNNEKGSIKTSDLDEDPWYRNHYEIVRGEGGAFTITGELSENTKNGDDSVDGALIYIKAVDKAGNESSHVVANVVYDVQAGTDPSGPSGTGGGGSGISSHVIRFVTGSDTVISEQRVRRNAAAEEPEAPTRDGYIFAGWYTDKELTEPYDFATEVTKDITLYAKWEAGTGGTEEWENPFTDVHADDWFYGDVEYAVENGLFNGTTGTTFAPNDNLTRAMLVTVLYRAEGEPAVNKSIPFADVDMSAYYANAVVWAQQNGIVKGYSEREFAPDEPILREQIGAILFRYAVYKGMDTLTAEENLLRFEDAEEISEYAVSAMNWAVGAGLLQGKTESTVNPRDNATRAEVAAMLHRFIEGNQ